ncbi:50S ribosomal protein L11 [Candidatus Bathyarchaeota archaeon]|jgi:large subunit ribosomal protein L11|nr:50S ribosomal protein L11 [Candidatus Bathyarchaeota archaeon]
MVEKKKIDALVSGGQATAGPPLGPALGPLGLNVLAVVKKINELTAPYAGMKVPVKVTVDTDTKEFDVEVGTPTVSALIVKELGIPKGSGTPNSQKVGNLSFEQLVHVAKLKQAQTLAKSFKDAVKEVAGSCVSVGITIEGKDPKEVQKDIDEGIYDKFLNP